MIPLVLVTGFLGSGKTTWLKQIARDHADRRFIYLVNDFASIDVDGELVRQAGDHVVALSGGSIFCRCLVTDFIRTLREVAAGTVGMEGQPDAVIIEASGMADPRVIHQMLAETKLDSVFVLQRIIALADPGTLHKLLKTLPTIRAQMECADAVLITKSDCYSRDEIDETRRLIQEIQPTADCRLMIKGETDLDLFAKVTLSTAEGDYALCKDPNFHRFVVTETVLDLDGFRARVEASGPALFRAKGFLEDQGQVYAVDWSSSGLHAEVWLGVAPARRIVCISQGEAGKRVEQVWRGAEPKGKG